MSDESEPIAARASLVPAARRPARILALGLPVVAVASGAGWLYFARGQPELPPDLAGRLVYVSDRSGVDSLYLRKLPKGDDERLTYLAEPTREPVLSPDAAEVAFSMGGRIGVVSLRAREVQFLTLGVDWKDAAPAWHPDGKTLVVSARRAGDANADLHLLERGSSGAGAAAIGRRALTETAGLDELSPRFVPDASGVVFVRAEQLFRLDLPSGRVRRMTSGFRVAREPRFLPSGKLMFLWTEGKRFGIDVIDADGHNRETLAEGSAYYRSVAPAPDGRYLAATLTFDLGFHPAEALGMGSGESLRLLDERGRPLGDLVRSWRRANHSPAWGPP